ncbi:MAG TPA: tetratricopeptide repeat protein, partial [Thermoanaerobaculia bacterium]|nr:tetratricopeptide repeat protein [Thermoanaerobaculia bacterium]
MRRALVALCTLLLLALGAAEVVHLAATGGEAGAGPAGAPAAARAGSAAPAASPLTPAASSAAARWKAGLELLSSCVSSIRSLLVNSLLILLLLVLLGVGIWEFRRETVVLYPIDLPKDLIDKGYTPQGVAQRIAAEIFSLRRAARLSARLEEGYELSSAQLDFSVPSAGISYRNLLRYARQFLGRPEERVQGEIVHAVQEVFTAHARGEIERDTPVLRIVLRAREGRTTPGHLAIPEGGDLDELLRKAAFELVSILDPVLVASYWFYKGKLDKAGEAARRAIARTPVEQHHRAYSVWGNALVVGRRFDEAEEKYRQAAALQPGFASAYSGWGSLKRAQRRFDAAAALYEQSLRLDSRQAYVWSNLGNVCADRRQYPVALRHFRHAIQLDPRYAAAWNGEGYALWRLGRKTEAEARLRRSLDLDPGFTWAYLNLARMRLEEGRLDEALETLREAQEKMPPTVEIYALSGDLLVHQNRFAAAEAMYGHARQLNPDLANGLAGMAFSLRKQRRFPAALSAYQEATEVDPFFTGAWAGWAETLRQLRRFDAAIEKYEALL